VQITTNIQLDVDERLEHTPEESAALVLNALGGDPADDYSVVYVQMSAAPGTAGTPPEPPEPA
jgi:hypothetical protein